MFYFLHCHAFKKYDIKLFNYLVHNGIIKWIFSNNRIDIKLDKYVDTRCDFIAKSKEIPKKYYDMVELNYNYQKKYNDKFNEMIEKNNIDKIISLLTNNNLKKENLSNEIKGLYLTILRDYNIIKIKLQYIFENIEKYKLSELLFNTSMFNIEKNLIFSYLLVNYYSENLLEKLKGVDNIYQNFYDKDINNLYEIKNILYANGKIKLLTNIKIEYRQLILYLTIDDDHSIQNIMYISPIIFKYLNKPIVVKYNKILKINIEESKDKINSNNEVNKKTFIDKNSTDKEYLISIINQNFNKYLYDIIKNNT